VQASYAQVVVDVRPAHLDRPFDYAIPDGWDVAVGHRVRVPFAGRRRDGWVVGVSSVSEASRVLPLAYQQGAVTWFDATDLALFRWVADRWAGTVADVLRHALPKRVAGVEQRIGETEATPRHPRGPAGDGEAAWGTYQAAALLESLAGAATPGAFWVRPLPGDEVALGVDLVARALDAGRSAVVLAPDPSSALVEAVLDLGGPLVADLRADQAERARYRAFLRARSGDSRVVVGERGAALAPARDLGLLLVDDEANPAYKERRSPRHHAREVVLARARMAGATAVLQSDVPSAALWRFVRDGHVRAVRADRATEHRRAPRVEVVDLAGSRTRLSTPASRALSEAVAKGGAAVVLAARGGEGAALACKGCRNRLLCPVCDGSVRSRRGSDERECPACGWSAAPQPCATCGDLRVSPLAAGAGRLAQELARSHPEAEVGRMEGFDAEGPEARPAIGVMTRGSVVSRPRWLRGERASVLVIPDADAMRGRAALEAGEDALRLWMAAARVADRVVIQTREPRDAAVQALVRWDPDGFWEREAEWRTPLGFPPARALVRVVAPADDAEQVGAALREALAADGGGQVAPGGPVEVLGPDPDGALLVKTPDLRGTLRVLRPLREQWGRKDSRVRVDVDPVPAG
jgi:primosomal protein N' (replication factor Y) (superfamily II helicase)